MTAVVSIDIDSTPEYEQIFSICLRNTEEHAGAMAARIHNLVFSEPKSRQVGMQLNEYNQDFFAIKSLWRPVNACLAIMADELLVPDPENLAGMPMAVLHGYQCDFLREVEDPSKCTGMGRGDGYCLTITEAREYFTAINNGLIVSLDV